MGYVTSKDGTSIAYERKGEGNPIILVDGAFCSRSFGPMERLSLLLSERFTVYHYDRRGRGSSSDHAAYAIEREIEDLDALLKETGGEASVFGMSSGAVLSLLAAAAGLPIRKLALYEPPYMPGAHPQGDPAAQITKLALAGRRGDAVGVFMTQVMGMPEAAFHGMRQAPTFPAMEAVAHTLAYDVTITGDHSLVGKLEQIAVPTLVIGGENSPPPLRQAVEYMANGLPHAKSRVLEGQTHDVNLDVLAPVLDAFFAD